MAASLVILFVGLSACAGGDEEADAPASQQQMMAADPIERGRASFETFCASCHGVDGKGGGPVADVLTTPPADLTQLRERHDGAFPADTVYAYIDGRQDVQAHGTREMPVWGNVWSEADEEPVSRDEVDLRIRELVEYIRTLQETSEEPA